MVWPDGAAVDSRGLGGLKLTAAREHMEVPEIDWKVFRSLRERALERFAEHVLGELTRICSDRSSSAHERYLRIHRLLAERDRSMATAFDHLSRSRMLQHLALAAMTALGLVEAEDLSNLSRETQDRVRVFDGGLP